MNRTVSPAAPRWLAAGALVLGALAAFARDPFPATRASAGTISALELAAILRARAADLLVLDLRSPESYAEGHVASARQAAPASPVIADLPPETTIVLYADSDAAASQAANALRASGHRDARVLRGGYASWVDDVLAPTLDATLPTAERARIGELSRYFGGQPRLGDTARPRLQGRGC